VNFDILMSKERKNCLCTAMLYDPKDPLRTAGNRCDFKQHSQLVRAVHEHQKEPDAEAVSEQQKEIWL
jgi:uncharacterized protein YeaC (DUF1315 family)